MTSEQILIMGALIILILFLFVLDWKNKRLNTSESTVEKLTDRIENEDIVDEDGKVVKD